MTKPTKSNAPRLRLREIEPLFRQLSETHMCKISYNSGSVEDDIKEAKLTRYALYRAWRKTKWGKTHQLTITLAKVAPVYLTLILFPTSETAR